MKQNGRFLASVCGIILLVNTIALAHIAGERRQELREAKVNAANLATTIEAGLDARIRQIDVVMRGAAAAVARLRATGDAEAIDATLRQWQNLLPPGGILRAADATGIIRWGLNPGERRDIDISQHVQFTEARATPDNLAVGPLLISRFDGRAGLPVARAISSADGAFAGVVTALISVAEIEALLQRIDVGPQGALSIYDGERQVVARHPDLPGGAAGRVVSQPEMVAFARSGHLQSTFISPSSLDGIRRVFVARRMAVAPLYVSVGIAEADALAPWRSEALYFGIFMVIFTIALAATTAIGLRGLQQARDVATKLQRANDYLTASPAVVYATEPPFTPTFVSDNVTALTGYDAAAFLTGNAFTANLHPEDRNRLPEHPQADGVVEYRFRFADGSWHWMRDEFWIVSRDETGKAREIIGSWIDISREKAAETAKSRFLDTMAHEIRTPLHCLLGAAEYLGVIEPPSSPAATQLHGILIESGALLKDLVDDFLDLSKLQNGSLPLHFEACPPGEIAQAAERLIADRARDKGLALRVTCQDGLPDAVLADRRRLIQVLLNLLANAVKFTEQGEIVLEVAPAGRDDRPAVAFIVTDNGIGMDPDILANLFSPFFQADNGMTRQFQGTGIGLAISKRLAEEMGGIITVASTPGQGSRFRVVMPAAVSAPPAPPDGREKTLPPMAPWGEDALP